jgi:hypothetical protein
MYEYVIGVHMILKIYVHIMIGLHTLERYVFVALAYIYGESYAHAFIVSG